MNPNLHHEDDLVYKLSLLPSALERLLFVTAPLERTYESMRLSIAIREPGCWFSASYGEGKTRAMEYCAEALAKNFPGLPVFAINEHVVPGNELRSFLVNALTVSHHEKPNSSLTDTLPNRLSRYWSELAMSSPLGCVVVLLDEGQALRRQDDSLLKDIGNEISLQGGSLYIIIFGESPSLDLLVAERLASFSITGAVDRLYAGHKLNLATYESLEDWESLFSGMENDSFDLLGNVTVSHAFFGHMDTSSYSMESEAERFFKALQSLAHIDRVRYMNLRRKFVAIRHGLLSAALLSVSTKTRVFGGVPEDQWRKSLIYASNSEGLID